MNPFDICIRIGCGHYRGVHLAGVGCVWCNCDRFFSKLGDKFKGWL